MSNRYRGDTPHNRALREEGHSALARVYRRLNKGESGTIMQFTTRLNEEPGYQPVVASTVQTALNDLKNPSGLYSFGPPLPIERAANGVYFLKD